MEFVCALLKGDKIFPSGHYEATVCASGGLHNLRMSRRTYAQAYRRTNQTHDVK